jgi:hypothetical protein
MLLVIAADDGIEGPGADRAVEEVEHEHSGAVRIPGHLFPAIVDHRDRAQPRLLPEPLPKTLRRLLGDRVERGPAVPALLHQRLEEPRQALVPAAEGDVARRRVPEVRGLVVELVDLRRIAKRGGGLQDRRHVGLRAPAVRDLDDGERLRAVQRPEPLPIERHRARGGAQHPFRAARILGQSEQAQARSFERLETRDREVHAPRRSSVAVDVRGPASSNRALDEPPAVGHDVGLGDGDPGEVVELGQPREAGLRVGGRVENRVGVGVLAEDRESFVDTILDVQGSRLDIAGEMASVRDLDGLRAPRRDRLRKPHAHLVGLPLRVVLECDDLLRKNERPPARAPDLCNGQEAVEPERQLPDRRARFVSRGDSSRARDAFLRKVDGQIELVARGSDRIGPCRGGRSGEHRRGDREDLTTPVSHENLTEDTRAGKAWFLSALGAHGIPAGARVSCSV